MKDIKVMQFMTINPNKKKETCSKWMVNWVFQKGSSKLAMHKYIIAILPNTKKSHSTFNYITFPN